MQPSSRVTVVVAIALALLCLAIIVLLVPRPSTPATEGPAADEPAPRWAPPAALPPAAATPGAGIATLADADWVASTAAATGIPERAVAAYAGAVLDKAATMPQCGISWTTLAGIGTTESGNGTHGGATIAADGTVSPPIYGPPLDGGEGVEHIPDSDGGAIDGSAEIDRASGPFQLIPQTWRNWHTDGNADGVEDPQNIDDAAMATVNYLCRAVTGEGLDFTTEEGWRAGVASFNSPSSYLDTVATFAVRFEKATSSAG